MGEPFPFGRLRVINLRQETSFLAHDLGKMAQKLKYPARFFMRRDIVIVVKTIKTPF